MIHVSVIVCTHNPRRDYLSRTLEALKTQTLPKDQWELLLIDNASEEPVKDEWDLSWHPHGRCVCEVKLGLTSARLRGIVESQGELLVFLDDDNLASADYLEVALALAKTYRNLGCFGAGIIQPEYDVEPLPGLELYLPMLALRSLQKAKWSNDPRDNAIPWGAGLVVRRGIAIHFKETVNQSLQRMNLGRKGQQLNSCEDDEFSWVTCDMGFGKGVFPELAITHLIDKKRVQLEYLVRIAEGHAYSHVILDHIHDCLARTLEEKPPAFSRILKALFYASVSDFFYEGHRWWADKHKSEIEKLFETARRKGERRALQDIALQEQANNLVSSK